MHRFRLKTKMWIDALRRRAEAKGAFVMVVQTGDPDAGSIVILTENNKHECALYQAQTQMDGSRAWSCQADLSQFDIKEKLNRLARLDEDMWVVEIVSKTGQHYIDEPILPL